MATNPEIRAHQEWIGYVQPVGVVVSPAALHQAQAQVDRNIVPTHRRFLEWVGEGGIVADLPGMLRDVCGWRENDIIDAASQPDPVEVVLQEYGEVLRPTFVVPEPLPAPEASPWLMLVQEVTATDLDEVSKHDHDWNASAQARFERLLRETRVPIGLLSNGTHLRLVYAPRGETSGHATFRVADMAEVTGRPIFAAFHMLLSADRMFVLPQKQRLPAILADSRKFQNEVSTKLAGQVLAALYELVRGVQSADAARGGTLLGDVLRDDPDHVYAGLLTVLLRLVFVLFAEDRDLLSRDPVYLENYSAGRLFERLREDAGRNPDTMDHRYGAWTQLLTLFRIIHDGTAHGGLRLPERHGGLFDPDRFNFLEGRPWHVGRVMGETIDPARISDGVVYRVLDNLLMLDGERLSYRTLDVEQIGSVYEAMMGFRMEVAGGPSIAIKAVKRHGAPVAINLDVLLNLGSANRAKWLREQTDQKVTDREASALTTAKTHDDVVAGLERKVDKKATPTIVPEGSMLLQPSEERRRSGSHYTPRSLTEPIVRTTLRPVLEALSPHPTPEQILDLKVLDPTMGSGAFLVEACRQLADELVKAWHKHHRVPAIPPDEDELKHAQRLIVQRCLYGVDKNPLAVDLAKLSLWLATLASEHPFTFLDHALRVGDSLVGLTRRQIENFDWKAKAEPQFAGSFIADAIAKAAHLRAEIRDAPEDADHRALRRLNDEAEFAVGEVRTVADLAVSAFFQGGVVAPRRESNRLALTDKVRATLTSGKGWEELRGLAAEMHEGLRPVSPLHWEIEFPEVFDRQNPGFDAIVGNPPFLGGTLIGGRLGLAYHDYLMRNYAPATGLADIVAFFLRRSFLLIRHEGTLGLLATNTVAQGDTRSTGLEQLLREGGSLYQAQRRYQWPGDAAVVVSLLHVAKTHEILRPMLNGVPVPRISAYLLSGSADAAPVSLQENKGICFRGTKIWGAGFVFEDRPSNGSSSLDEMEHLISGDPRNREVLFAYLGGEEFNSSPTQTPSRYVIDFGDMSEADAMRWPALFSIVEERVRPVRAHNKQRNYREQWWLHANRVEEAGPYLRQHGRLLALTCVSTHVAAAFVHRGTIIQDRLILLLMHDDANFGVIQSRVHDAWVRLVGTTLGDALSYTTTCFDSFPHPSRVDLSTLEEAGAGYYNFRAHVMEGNNEGLTKTYNRFHDPNERSPEIARLREMHAEMDRAVLDAYGWTNLKPIPKFIEEHPEDEESEGGRQRRKSYRYRWPDETRDEVLARLLNLNAKRAEQERLAGPAAKPAAKKRRVRRAGVAAGSDATLFVESAEEVE